MGTGTIVDGRAGITLVRDAFELRVPSFDTAETYGPFTNQELLGEAVTGRYVRQLASRS
jgi:aryl-alcohol dehydrogenase-like predicted oxidoreductase